MEIIGDLSALLIVGALGYNCFNRVRKILRDNRDAEQKRTSASDKRIQPYDAE